MTAGAVFLRQFRAVHRIAFREGRGREEQERGGEGVSHGACPPFRVGEDGMGRAEMIEFGQRQVALWQFFTNLPDIQTQCLLDAVFLILKALEGPDA